MVMSSIYSDYIKDNEASYAGGKTVEVLGGFSTVSPFLPLACCIGQSCPAPA